MVATSAPRCRENRPVRVHPRQIPLFLLLFSSIFSSYVYPVDLFAANDQLCVVDIAKGKVYGFVALTSEAQAVLVSIVTLGALVCAVLAMAV